jgi:hypothetical protein
LFIIIALQFCIGTHRSDVCSESIHEKIQEIEEALNPLQDNGQNGVGAKNG